MSAKIINVKLPSVFIINLYGVFRQEQKIFNQIGELSSSPEFLDAQMDFFRKNCLLFSNEEENKLEYTTIYETYVALIE